MIVTGPTGRFTGGCPQSGLWGSSPSLCLCFLPVMREQLSSQSLLHAMMFRFTIGPKSIADSPWASATVSQG